MTSFCQLRKLLNAEAVRRCTPVSALEAMLTTLEEPSCKQLIDSVFFVLVWSKTPVCQSQNETTDGEARTCSTEKYHRQNTP